MISILQIPTQPKNEILAQKMPNFGVYLLKNPNHFVLYLQDTDKNLAAV